MAKRTFEILRGSLVLGNDVRAVGPIVQTDDAQIIRDLEGLGEVKDALGSAQYVRELENYKGEITGRIVNPGEGKVSTTTTQPDGSTSTDVTTLKYPTGVNERDVERLEAHLKEAGHTFETANLLSDDDLLPLKNIGKASITLLRSIGTENNYPAHGDAPAGDTSEG